MRYNLDERLKLASLRKFHAQIIVGSLGEYLQVEAANYAASTTQAVLMFLKDCEVQKDYLYYLRLIDVDGTITYWLAGWESDLDILVVKPCPNTIWRQACAGVSNTRTRQRYVDNLGTGNLEEYVISPTPAEEVE